MMHAKQAALPRKKDGLLRRILINIRQYPVLYLMTIPVIAYFIIFKYIPMYGVVIAFKKFSPAKGILGSPWLGLDHFQAFFSDLYCFRVIRNTLLINLYGLIFGFPFPIIFALLLNEVRSNAFRRVTQTITYMPHFVSVVIICGLTKYFLKSDGLITGLLVNMFNLPRTNMLAVSAYFRTIYTAMNIWQGFGWGSIIYFAALTNVDPALIEAAAEQLTVWAERARVPIVKHEEGADPAAVVFDAIQSAKAQQADLLIVDTAGRLHNKKNLMDELAKINRVIDRELPGVSRETLLVLDSTTGQNAVMQAKEFMNAAAITGLILTKLDGTAKGGAIFSIKNMLGIPVKFIGVGEKIDDMQPFDAKMFVDALFDGENDGEDGEVEG